jgi:hypothetical protein
VCINRCRGRGSPHFEKKYKVLWGDLNRTEEDKKRYGLLREGFNSFIEKKGLYAIEVVQADADMMSDIGW